MTITFAYDFDDSLELGNIKEHNLYRSDIFFLLIN